MGAPERPPANGFVRVARKVYNPIGFKKGYNFILFFIFNGALLGFVLARLSYLSIWGVFCNASLGPMNSAAPGECYWYSNFPTLKAGITLHLACILPAGLLAVLQFVPIIRYKVLIWHRVSGYLIIILVFCGLIGALMICAHAFGGSFATQTFVGATSIMTIFSMFMAYVNIKRLQIDQHRAWMIRTWFYLGTIITLRLVMFIGVLIIAQWPRRQQYTALSCGELAYMELSSNVNQSALWSVFPACNPSTPGFNNFTMVKGVYGSYAAAVNIANGGAVAVGAAAETAVAMGQLFGPAGWIAFFMHLVGVEIYLKLTPKENERLKQVSYERQLERGYKNPGMAGLTAERFGDSEPFMPKKPAVERFGSETSVQPGYQQVWAGQNK